jgi:DNA-binding transcriptional regulator YiaG
MDLAYKVGVHLNTLAGWERGSSKPSFEHLRLLRELLPALG